MSSHIAAQLTRLNHGAVVELFVLDLSAYGQSYYRFANQVNELGQPITWQGQVYQPLPFQASGFAQRGSGTFPRPHLKVSNTVGALGAFLREYDNLRGARVVRRSTMATYLDAVNFAAGNALADPLAAFQDEPWVIDRTVQRNKLVIEWELANPIDVPDAVLPGRTVWAQHCELLYRGAKCGYSGPAVAKGDDTATTDLAQDACSHKVSGCRLRFGNGPIPASFFPGVGVNRQN